jgi:hypothetical protein
LYRVERAIVKKERIGSGHWALGSRLSAAASYTSWSRRVYSWPLESPVAALYFDLFFLTGDECEGSRPGVYGGERGRVKPGAPDYLDCGGAKSMLGASVERAWLATAWHSRPCASLAFGRVSRLCAAYAAFVLDSTGMPALRQASNPPCNAQTFWYPRSRSFCAKLALEPSFGQVQ